jgi:hypothetical protein
MTHRIHEEFTDVYHEDISKDKEELHRARHV